MRARRARPGSAWSAAARRPACGAPALRPTSSGRARRRGTGSAYAPRPPAVVAPCDPAHIGSALCRPLLGERLVSRRNSEEPHAATIVPRALDQRRGTPRRGSTGHSRSRPAVSHRRAPMPATHGRPPKARSAASMSTCSSSRRSPTTTAATAPAASPATAPAATTSARKLKQAGYEPRVQAFEFPFFEQTGPSTFELTGRRGAPRGGRRLLAHDLLRQRHRDRRPGHPSTCS